MFRITPLEHTADKGIRVEAESLAEIMAGAATGMFASMVDLDGLEPTVRRDVAVSAADREALLVAWLQELIFLFEVEDLVFFDFEIRSATETALAAVARGCPWPEDRPRIGAAVKAVTYYGLHVEQTPAGWSAEVVFDV
jgi:SHS2 domain-containing protein